MDQPCLVLSTAARCFDTVGTVRSSRSSKKSSNATMEPQPRSLAKGMPAMLLLLMLLCWEASASQTMPLSPIKNLDASLAASSAQGTHMALCLPHCVAILSHKSSSSSAATTIWDPARRLPRQQQRTVFGLPHVQLFQAASYAPSRLTTRNSIYCFTGFGPDVEHLVRRLQQSESQYFSVYGETSCIRLWKTLMRWLQGTTGRPYAVQVLMVGMQNDSQPFVYTTDPTGNWNTWQYGTAVGRYAGTVRKYLAQRLRLDGDGISEELDLKEGLRLMIGAWVDTCKEESVSLDRLDEDVYEATIVWRDCDNVATSTTNDSGNKKDNIKMGELSSEALREMVRDVLKDTIEQ